MLKERRWFIVINEKIVNHILKSYNTPFYVFDEDGFINNYEKIVKAFRNVYPNYSVAYSFKTNYTPYICDLIRKHEGYAEVVSDMELILANKLGFPAEKIIYNGPCKGNMIESHLVNGGILNIDNYEEAKTVTHIAGKHSDQRFGIGLRLNFDIGAEYISRFGLETGSEELDKAIQLLNNISNIKIVGLHCHFSRARGLQAWENRIDKMLEFAEMYIDGVPEYLDLGSGMFADMDKDLKKQFSDVPTYEQYADIVAGAMKRHYGDSDDKTTLITEPGTTLVSRYFTLVTKAVNRKIVQGKSFTTVDSSIYNIGEICQMKVLPNYVINMNESNLAHDSGPTEVMGYTCLEQDCMFHDYNHDLYPGDILVIGNVGGYSIVSKPPFIQPNCPILCMSSSRDIFEIKRQETFDDVFCTFKF